MAKRRGRNFRFKDTRKKDKVIKWQPGQVANKIKEQVQEVAPQPPIRVFLDESIMQTQDEQGYFSRGRKLRSDLMSLYNIDAYYVGQTGPDTNQFTPRNFRQSPDSYWDDYHDEVEACFQKARDQFKPKLATPTGRGHRGMASYKINREFKNCVNKAEEHMGYGAPQWARVPPRGTDDRDIRQFCRDYGLLIISADRGQTLEPHGQTDRIAISIWDDLMRTKRNIDAKMIADRIFEVKELFK